MKGPKGKNECHRKSMRYGYGRKIKPFVAATTSLLLSKSTKWVFIVQGTLHSLYTLPTVVRGQAFLIMAWQYPNPTRVHSLSATRGTRCAALLVEHSEQYQYKYQQTIQRNNSLVVIVSFLVFLVFPFLVVPRAFNFCCSYCCCC